MDVCEGCHSQTFGVKGFVLNSRSRTRSIYRSMFRALFRVNQDISFSSRGGLRGLVIEVDCRGTSSRHGGTFEGCRCTGSSTVLRVASVQMEGNGHMSRVILGLRTTKCLRSVFRGLERGGEAGCRVCIDMALCSVPAHLITERCRVARGGIGGEIVEAEH